jgi:hypothetical protein
MRVVGPGLFLAFVVVSSASAMSGVIVSADGKPVPSATIEIARAQSAAERHAIAVGLRKSAPPIAHTTSGPDGSFSVKLDVTGIVQVNVRVDGFAPAAVLTTSDDDLVAVRLDPATMKKGRVTGGGAPVKGALVVVDDERGQTLAVRTAPDGTFSIPAPERWASRITILHPDYAIFQSGANELTSLNFAMTAGIPLPGVAIERADGSAATDYTYLVTSFPLATIHGDTRSVFATAVRDQELRVEIPGEMAIVLDRATKKPIRTAATKTIEGTIRDERGRALAGVPVVAWSEHMQGTLAEGAERSAISDANGRYRIEVAGSSRYIVMPYVAEVLQFKDASADLRRAKSATLNFSASVVRFTTGVVTGDEQKPVGGAMVTVLPDTVPVLYAHVGARGWPIAITDASGRYRLRATYPEGPDTAGSGLADTAMLPKLRATAVVPGYAATTSEKFAMNKLPSRIDIRLSRGVELAGRVTLLDGQPVEGVSVVAAESRVASNGALAASLSSNALRAWTLSDKDGRFALHVQDQPHTLGVWKEGFAPSDVSDVHAGDRNVVVTLDRGHAISGKIRGGTASTKSGLVTASAQNREAFAQTTVDSSGRFTIPNLPSGTYVVRYQDEQGYAEVIAQAPSEDVSLELPERRNLTGKVVDEAGSPIASFSISQRSENFSSMDPSAEPITGESGEFSISATVGECTVTVSSPGFGTSEQRVIVSERTPPLTFVLKRARLVTGRVTNSSGAGISNVSIETDESQRSNYITTDDSGEFAIEDADTAEFTLKTRSDDYLATSATVPAGSTETRVDLVVPRGESLSGRVVDPKGSGVSRAQISVRPLNHEADFRFAISEADGTFTAKGLAKGRYSIEARLAGTTAAVEADISDGKPLLIVLKPSVTGSVSGTVKLPSSSGWSHIMILAQGTDGQQFARADRDGSFLVENVPAGDVAVMATVNSGNSQRSSRAVHVTVLPEQKAEVELSMEGGSTVRGTVTRDGSPAVGASVEFQSLVVDSMVWRATADLHGAYVVEGVAPGDYEVTATSLTLRVSRPFTVSGDSTTFDVRIEDHAITGHVVDSKGVGISDATVQILGPTGHHESVEAKTAANGEFLLRTSDSFPMRLAASKSGFGPVIRSLDAQPSSPLVVTLNSTAGLRVRLVASDSGAALTGYTAVRDSDGIEIPAAQEEQRDGVVLLSLPAGSYQVSASAAGYASRTVRAQVPLEGDLRIALSHGGSLVVISHDAATDLVKLVAPNGEEYVQCYCSGIATIRLKGKSTTIEHVQAGNYMLQILNGSGGVTTQQPITIVENGKTTVDLERQ